MQVCVHKYWQYHIAYGSGLQADDWLVFRFTSCLCQCDASWPSPWSFWCYNSGQDPLDAPVIFKSFAGLTISKSMTAVKQTLDM